FLFFVFLLAVPILTLAAYMLSRHISRPIVRLARAAEELAKGDLSTRVSVQTTGEVQMLVESFNSMAEDIALTTVSKEYVDNIINSMIDTLIVVSPEGNILQANASACSLLGYKEEELLGQGFEMVVKEGTQNSSTALDDLITMGYVGNTEQTYIAKDGRRIPVLFSGAAMQDSDGTIQGIVCVAQDITDRKHAEEQLKSFAAKLEASNKELENFAYVASHDLQEPLRKVTAFGDQLQTKYGKKLGEKGGDYLERMRGAAQRMQSLIKNLLTYSRVTTKAQPFVPVNLGSVAREVLSDLEVRIVQTKGRVDVDDLPIIDADPLQMRQLFQNLIANALKFHRDGDPPVVTIRSALISGNGTGGEQSNAAGELCRITFSDNGIGFDEKYIDRIFGVFQRLHGRNEYEGTGIGLAICRKLVERHGGTITTTSTPGQGAVFTVLLPVAHEQGGEQNA
ncbi:MAG TPA: diguanylate cyclase, partial [Nitrospiraceae bacterium]|nr:diguanylate cyclase [Nitrospiraceae bacterium]